MPSDIRLGARRLLKDRWFAGAAILVLGLGIAATNTALDPTSEISGLVALQLPTGAWPGFGCLYALGSGKTPPIYFGSPALTAAFAVRALSPAPRGRPVRGEEWSAVVDRLTRDLSAAHCDRAPR